MDLEPQVVGSGAAPGMCTSSGACARVARSGGWRMGVGRSGGERVCEATSGGVARSGGECVRGECVRAGCGVGRGAPQSLCVASGASGRANTGVCIERVRALQCALPSVARAKVRGPGRRVDPGGGWDARTGGVSGWPAFCIRPRDALGFCTAPPCELTCHYIGKRQVPSKHTGL